MAHASTSRYILTLLALLCFVVPTLAQGAAIDALFGAVTPATLTPLVTWKTSGVVPLWYTGRVLPIRGGNVDLTVMSIDSFGTPVDIGNELITWRINNKFVTEGTGMRRFSFTIKDLDPDELAISATIQNGKTVLGEGRVTVPVVAPKLLVSVPYANKVLPGQDAVLQALPFFLPIKDLADLAFSWRIEGTELPSHQTVGGTAVASFDGTNSSIPVFVTATSRTDPSLSFSASTLVSVR